MFCLDDSKLGSKTYNPADARAAKIAEKFKKAKKFVETRNYTKAIEIYTEIIETPEIDSHSFIEARMALARTYKEIGEYTKSQYYYELVEHNYKSNNQQIGFIYSHFDIHFS